MTEQAKNKQVVRATILLKKNPTSAYLSDQNISSSRFSVNTNQVNNQDYLTQNIKNLNSTVKQLAQSVNKLTTSLSHSSVLQLPTYIQKATTKSKGEADAIQTSKQFQKNKSKQIIDLEERDRKIKIVADDFLEDGELKNKKRIQLWTAKVCQGVFSSAFHKFKNRHLSLEQAKSYCSENIINNIVDLCLSQKQTLQEQHLKIIDHHIKREICPYMLEKYPMTETNMVNKNLQNLVKQVDNIQCQKNNIFYMASEDCFGFQYRQSGNYNDLIMKFMNELLEKIDEQQQNNQIGFPTQDLFKHPRKSQDSFLPKTIYQKFHCQMTKIFQIVFKKQGNIEKTQNQIKQYTSWLIGRKVSENVPKYSQYQITNMTFQIKHPSVLRILTKWCIELQSKFEPDYFLNNFDCIFSSRGKSIINVTKELREDINQELKIQSEEIKQYLKKIEENKYKQQSSSLKSSIAADIFTNMEKTEQCCGLFSVNTVDDLHTYIILYLNRLIHGLLRVAKNVYESSEKLRRYDYVPNLLTFTICDIMRCKISSKQQEIRRIYNLIMEKNNQKDSGIKVIQVKNRLKRNTNYIQVNIRFKEKYLCQIQLAVNSEQSHFMQCSNKFNHFIYQLKRSIFGPISELCSIRKSLDSRSKIYQKMAQRLSQYDKNKNSIKTKCINESQEHDLLKQAEMRFNCSECGQCSVNLSCFKSHLYCEKCRNYWRCGRCDLKSKDQEKLKNQQLAELTKEERQNLILIKEDEQIPEYGVFFSITEKVRKLQQFAKVKYKEKWGIYIPLKQDRAFPFLYLHSHPRQTHLKSKEKIKVQSENKQQKKFVIFTQFKSKKCEQKFKKVSIIFAKKIPLEHQKITKQQVKQQSLKKRIESVYSKKKEQIYIMNEQLSSEDCQYILEGDEHNTKMIKIMDLTQNKLSDLSFLNRFTQLRRLFLTKNEITEIKSVQSLSSIRILFIDSNKLNKFPQEILKLQYLKELNISKNNFQGIPERIKQITRLQKLVARDLRLKKLPDSFKQLINLKCIILENNQFQFIPQGLNIPSLQIIALNKNKIAQIEDWVCELPSLRVLQLNQNKLQGLPAKIQIMTSLQKFEIKKNQIVQIKQRRLPCNLKCFDISQNGVCQINDDIFDDCKHLQTINFSQHNLSQLPNSMVRRSNLVSLNLSSQISRNFTLQMVAKYFPTGFYKLKNIKFLYLSGSVLVPDMLQNLGQYPALQQLQISKMQLEIVPNAIKTMKNLNFLNLSFNKISKFDDNFFNKLLELRQLNLQSNLLESLPQSVHSCKYLRLLNLSQNKIKLLQLDLEKLRSLAIIYVLEDEQMTIFDTAGLQRSKRLYTAKKHQRYKNTLQKKLNQLGCNYLFERKDSALAMYNSRGKKH